MMTIRKNLPALVAMLLAAVAVPAVGQIVQTEYGVEASADGMLMPSSASGSIVLTCETCQQQAFRLSDETVYLIGAEQVSFTTFAAYIRGTSRHVGLFVKLDEPVVKRIVVAPGITPARQ
jgi:hypothetical protein